jgi:hypothetical protein
MSNFKFWGPVVSGRIADQRRWKPLRDRPSPTRLSSDGIMSAITVSLVSGMVRRWRPYRRIGYEICAS